MRVDVRRCEHCTAAIAQRSDERPNAYAQRRFCNIHCLGAAKVAHRASRFWQRVARGDPSACWNWTGKLTHSGYGAFGVQGKHWRAHRYALVASGVEVPADKLVMHTCDNRACCNPAHLRVGTSAENNQDMVEKGRDRYLSGEAHHNAKLTDDQRRIIAERRGEPLQVLADEFGVTKSTICRARKAALCA